MNVRRTVAAGVLLGILGMGGAVAGCKKPAPAPSPDKATAAPQAASARPPAQVRFARVETRRLPATLELTGTLDADERSEVAAQTTGAVLKVHVDVGSRVKEGDVLVEIDGREALLRVASANAQAKQQLARLGLKPGEPFDAEKTPEVRAAKDAYELAKLELERAQKLFDSGGLTKQALDQAKSTAQRAEAQLDAARNGAEQAWAGLLAAQAQARLSQKGADDTRIRAPFTGAVVEKRISPGEFANPGRVVAVLVRDDRLRLRVDVPEPDVGSISLGQPVEITVAAVPGRTFKGEIKRIGASLKVQSRSLPIEAEVPNESGELKPGFFARARIALSKGESDALLVPKAAVGSSGASSRVFVRAGDRVVERLVTTGREVGELVEVRGPVQAGEEVAVSGVAELVDGAVITAID